MKKIKDHVVCYCTFCKAAGVENVRAGWRPSGLTSDRARACDEHRPALKQAEDASRERESHMSEADHQSWGRL